MCVHVIIKSIKIFCIVLFLTHNERVTDVMNLEIIHDIVPGQTLWK